MFVILLILLILGISGLSATREFTDGGLILLQIPHQTYKIILVKNLFWRNDEASRRELYIDITEESPDSRLSRHCRSVS